MAQADAARAFEQGKAAYADGRFTEARDLFEKASQTDTRNPEVFLWLGKAQYQLGVVNKAVAAWTKTLKLAPEEPYAKKMLETLRGQLLEADTRISLIEVMLKEKLFAAAKRECNKLLEDQTMTDERRVRVMTLKARVLLGTGSFAQVEETVHELLTRHPKLADPAQTTLLLGEAKMGRRGKMTEGLRLLKKVVKDYPDTPSAVTARYKLIVFNLDQLPNPADARELAEWIAANPDHDRAEEARRQLINKYLAISRKQGIPKIEAELGKWDRAAVDTATDLLKRIIRADEALRLTRQIVKHLDSHYAKKRAYIAAISGSELLLKAPLPPTSRLAALRALARYKTELALERLGIEARAGRLVAGPLPKALAEVLGVYGTINKEFPAEPAWRSQGHLAERVRKLGSPVPWPVRITEPKVAYDWSVQIALPVIQADVDSSAVSKAIKTIRAIVNDCAKHEKHPARGMALGINSELLQVLAPTNPAWADAMWRQVNLLKANAVAVFNDNIKAGRAEENAKLGERQKQLLATLTKLVERQVSRQAPKALKELRAHLKLWVKHKHYKVAEQAYRQLAESLPEAQQRQAGLAVVKLWRQQVFSEHNRLMAAGLTVPRKLDPVLNEALELCYAAQEGLDEDAPFLTQARRVWDSIVGHYKRLEYFDTAEEAIKAKTSRAVTAADEYAKLQLANLKFEMAVRELNFLLKQYNASERITLTPSFKTAIEAYTKFISECSSAKLRNWAVEKVFRIARHFERHKAYDVAVGVYRDFAVFARKVKVLSQPIPGASNPAERAAFAAATALDAKARLALSKQMKEQKEPKVPPAKISGEFAAAIKAYKDFIKANPESVLLGRAVEKIMAVALEYAKADAWDVADGIYAELLAKDLAIRRVERIEFCRGLSQLGKAIPEHAKQVLTTLTLKETPRPEGREASRLEGVESSGYGAGRGVYAGESGGYAMAGAPADKSVSATPAPGLTLSTGSSTEPVSVARSGDELVISGNGAAFDRELALRDTRLVAAIRRQEATRAGQIARLREELEYRPVRRSKGQKAQARRHVPVLPDEEIARQEKTLNAAYEIFQGIRKKYPKTSTAEQSRGEIKVMIDHWRTLNQWQRAAKLTKRFLKDNPTDKQLPQLRLGIARDYLAWAAQPVEDKPSKQLMLTEVARRFNKGRDELISVVKSFPKERGRVQQAQWDIANSFLTQARVVDAFSPTLARGQYVRAAEELLLLADKYYDHPNIGTVPNMLWDISGELANRAYYDEAITVWNGMMIRYPTHHLAANAALRIAQTYQNNLKQPLRAAEAYQEVNMARGGRDTGIQNQIYQIGVRLKNEKRWVEALHVLEMFVDSFPRHPQAGQALTTIGQVHQTNEAWDEAIAAYRRVIDEFPAGDWVREAKWSIAECTINLSQWRQAMVAYEHYQRDYRRDGRAGEAKRRIGILKDLVRYQTLVDEKEQRKAFEAQYQIAEIVSDQLANRVKAIIEYRKVATAWPQSHRADDALYAVGTTYVAMGEMDKARDALRIVGKRYPGSPLADDALFMVGKSYEDEANRLAGATREQTLRKAEEVAQRQAYVNVQDLRARQRCKQAKLIASLKLAGKKDMAELEEARGAVTQQSEFSTNVALAAGGAVYFAEALTAVQLADRQDKVNAALRKAVSAYKNASKVAEADKAGDALLRMATIYDERLKDAGAAVATWLEIVRQFSGTSVAENASWRIAQHYERQRKYAEAIEAYKAFLRNYRRSPKAGGAQFAIAENYEYLGQWVNAMDAYTNYINNFPRGPMVQKAREQINWIKAYRL
jgi:TolA-binding protein